MSYLIPIPYWRTAMARPRVYPATETLSQSVTESNKRFRKGGGRIITVRLPPETVERLDKLRKRKGMPKATSALVVEIINQAPIRRNSAPLPPGKVNQRRDNT